MRETLWSWLSDQGYTVSGEVTLGNRSIIDLVAYDSIEEKYIGIEVKDQENQGQSNEIPSAIPGADVKSISNTSVNFQEAASHWKQVHRYQTSKYLDEIYFASQRPNSVIDSMNRESIGSADDSPSIDDIYAGDDATADQVGAIRLPGPHDDTTIEIIREAATLDREYAPIMDDTDEQWVQHYLWDHLGGVREGVLPNKESEHFRRIDIAMFTDSENPTKVYENQATNDIFGIEAKGAEAFPDGTSTIEAQLRKYVNCGALTRLYLTVPEIKRSISLSLLENNDLADVGLYTVDKEGSVTLVREAAKLPLKYDGIKTKEGYTVDIIWGYGDSGDWSYDQAEIYRSVFNMVGNE
jgi:hypothetical protein